MHESAVHEDLAWIRSLMDESHRFLGGTWRHQVVWGIVGVTGMLGTYASLSTGRFGLIPWLWVVSIGGGWFYSLVVARGGETSAAVRNAAARAFGGIWIGLGVTLTLLGGLTLFTGALEPSGLSGVIALVFGSGYFASGFVAGLRWMQGVAVGWWIGGVVLLYWPSPSGLLLLAAMIVVLEIGPALRLRAIANRADTLRG